MENGLPQNSVQALLQTRDGFLWLGTEMGLVRFDGSSFQVFDRHSAPALPGNDVRCLLETPDGALWVGTSDGLARWSSGQMTVFTTRDGLPGLSVLSLHAQEHGGFRVETGNGSADYVNGRFTQVSVASNVPAPPAAFHARLLGGQLAEADKTTVQISAPGKSPKQLKEGSELPGSRIQELFADREGSLWIGTNAGLVRWAGNRLQTFPVTDPLSAASVLTIMEDHEGNLWIGTEANGLHILRDQRFRTLGTRQGLSSDSTTAVVEDSAGTLWVGTSGDGLNSLQPAKLGAAADLSEAKSRSARAYSVRDGLSSDVILSLAAGPNGDVWVGTPDGLNHIRAGRIASFTSADGLPDDFVRSLLVDKDGSLWIGTRRGLTHWLNASERWTNLAGRNPYSPQMQTFTHASGLGSDLVGAMVRDANGDLWVATLAGLSRLHSGKIENYTTADGLSSNIVTALLVRKNKTLLIGTQDRGWNLWDGQRFARAGGDSQGLTQSSIHAILDDGEGHLWFATGNGIARGDCPEMNSGDLGAEPGGCTHWMQFGAADGIDSRDTAINSHPSAWRSRDGNLWFATPKGLVEVDPVHFPVNTIAPPVALERFAIDDVPQPLGDAAAVVRVPAGHVHFEFDYAGLSFVAPQKVRYRYILEGFDHHWTDAGARRTAYYTNIPPGHYTFRIQAANNDGVWNTGGAALRFDLRPHFYQTLWFYALLLALAVALVVLVQRLRLNRAQREFNAVLGERNRIAREIHDTLAQGYVGISVQLEVLAELLRMSKIDAAAKHLDLTRGYVREGLADARQSIWALRSQDSAETTLPVKLRRLVEAAGNHDLEAHFGVFGAYRSLPHETEREFLRVAQEAIHNVKKHADAKRLNVQLEYGPSGLVLEVSDDGKGFAASEAALPGHYGLTGMRERAAALGGTLEVGSKSGSGTVVTLRVAVPAETQVQVKESM